MEQKAQRDMNEVGNWGMAILKININNFQKVNEISL
jgi:predicted transport protein